MENTDLMRSLDSLVKFNNGVWKSLPQRKFLARVAAETGAASFQPSAAGLPMPDGRVYFLCSRSIRWADYGYRSRREVLRLYEMDDFGVVRCWKLHKNYSNNGLYSTINPEKYELLFERQKDADISTLADQIMAEEKLKKEQQEAMSRQKWLGNPGNKITVVGKVTQAKVVQGAFSSLLITVETMTGEQAVWFSSSDPGVQVGQVVEMVGKVKDLKEYRGRKQTIMTRCKIKVLKAEV